RSPSPGHHRFSWPERSKAGMAGTSPAMTKYSTARPEERLMNAPFKPIEDVASSFVRRHVGPSPRDVAAMLETVGAKSLADLMSQTLPGSIRQKAPLDLGRALDETGALAHMGELAAENAIFTSL